MPMTFDSYLLEMYFLNSEERASWGDPPITYHQYVQENLEWLEKMYEKETETFSD